MVTTRRGTITELELRKRVLDEIWAKEEVIESELYPLTGSKARIRPLLDNFIDNGILDVYQRGYGQKVPVYYYTERGRLFYLLVRYSHDFMASVEGTEMDDPDTIEIYGILRRIYGLDEDE